MQVSTDFNPTGNRTDWALITTSSDEPLESWQHNATLLLGMLRQFVTMMNLSLLSLFQPLVTPSAITNVTTTASPVEHLWHLLNDSNSTLISNNSALNCTASPTNITDADSTGISNIYSVSVIIFGVVLSVATAGGNLMVMISFKMDRQLQTISNYFLFSLAVADFFIGIISCPLMTVYTAQGRWTLGYVPCQFWLTVDYLMCNSSVMNLLLISFDRYFSVTRPLSYRPRRTTRKALVMISASYLVSLVLWPPWIIAWPYIEGDFKVPPETCVIQFLLTNPYVTVGMAIAAFYLPVLIMIGLYAKVFLVTQNRQAEIGKLQAFRRSSKSFRKRCQMPSDTPNSTSKLLLASNSKDQFDRHDSDAQLRQSRRQFYGRKKLTGQWVWLRCCRRGRKSEAARSVSMETWRWPPASDDSLYREDFGSPSERDMSFRQPPPTRNASDRRFSSISATIPTLKKLKCPRGSGGLITSPDRFKTASLTGDSDDHSAVYTVLIQLSDRGEFDRPQVTVCSDSPSLVGESSLSETVDKTPSLHRPIQRCRSDLDTSGLPISPTTTRTPLDDRIVVLNQMQKIAKSSVAKKRSSEKKQETKAARTLSAILLAFVLTWAPYNVLVILGAVWPDSIGDYWWTFSYFLCYINSTVNPLCYALCNANFKRTYVRILTCKWHQGKQPPTTRPNGFQR